MGLSHRDDPALVERERQDFQRPTRAPIERSARRTIVNLAVLGMAVILGIVFAVHQWPLCPSQGQTERQGNDRVDVDYPRP